MRTDRVYRTALPHDLAVVELADCSGSQLDPHIVEVLTAIVAPMAGGCALAARAAAAGA